MTPLKRVFLAGFLAATLAAPTAAAPRQLVPNRRVEVVAELSYPSLARAAAQSRMLAAVAIRHHRLALRAPASASYLRALASEQRALATHLVETIPGAHVRWRYGVVLNGFAVDLPSADVSRLAEIPGIARVYPSVLYHSELSRSPGLIGADKLWGPGFSSAGNGIKVGILDEGVDQTHPFFNPSGFEFPRGFPKGQRRYTTAKVIVARAFAPRSPKWRFAARPFDPDFSFHGTHVAGIAAGDYGLTAGAVTGLSGVAPNAYIGNYKVLTIPTESGAGLDGNSAEIVAGIEAAVRDGMNVINLSLGEPEIEPSRDIVVKAIDAAADAGVVPVIAAGNDFNDVGGGSIGSPGSARKAITAAAVTKDKTIADFSSGGPTPISLQLKPDVSAPGVGVLSSVPRGEGLWAKLDGTSMATPHVAGAAALLLQRHPTWSVDQLKSALVLTADPVFTASGPRREVPTDREGGGLVDLPRANDPLVFATPSSLSFGLVRPGAHLTRSIGLTDAGGGAGTWAASVEQQTSENRIAISVPATVDVPGVVTVSINAQPGAPEKKLTGFVLLTRGADQRRIPYWLRVDAPALGREPRVRLRRPGAYRGNTAGKPALVESYRYPENPIGLGVPAQLSGPEQVFRVRLRHSVPNFGVAVMDQDPGVSIEPRVVVAGDENRLVGYTGLPVNLNPYTALFQLPEPVVGAVRPLAGMYDIVFDSQNAATAGPFRFRFWIGDVTPPTIKLLSHTVTLRSRLQLRLADRGSGVDPRSLVASIDGRAKTVRYSTGTRKATISIGNLVAGRHQLVFRASDYQEAKNMEDVAQILPNTRLLRTTFRVA
jgi:subtilisin family serine protease